MTTKGDLAGIGIICSSNALEYLEAALSAKEPADVRRYIEKAQEQIKALLSASSAAAKDQ